MTTQTMIHGASPSDKISSPHATPVKWLCRCEAQKSRTTVTARTWFDARERGMRKLGCGPGEIVVVEK